MPDYTEWQRQMRAIGGCSNPIRLIGRRVVSDAATGKVIDVFDTSALMPGYLLKGCGNRRASRCPACSKVYQSDTYQLVRAGLAGGKDVPASVSEHPLVFVTLTAPSFGPVHARHRQTGRDGLPRRCRVRRESEPCPHGLSTSCLRRHQEDDEAVGQPLCPECYDYVGAVLWNAHAGQLWHAFAVYLDRHVAAAVGISRKALRQEAKRSYVKVAEYQARGLVHFHAVVRIDGPDGPTSPPPLWATTGLLEDAVLSAAKTVSVTAPGPDGDRTMRFGAQIDVQHIVLDDAVQSQGLSQRHVAGYVAKYATKAAEVAGAVDRRVRRLSNLDNADVTPHARRMIATCLELAELPEYRDTTLVNWAHMLGYRGHCTTKSAAYSTTLSKLRGDRAEHQAAKHREALGLPAIDPTKVVIDAEWRFVMAGLQRGEAAIVAALRPRQHAAT